MAWRGTYRYLAEIEARKKAAMELKISLIQAVFRGHVGREHFREKLVEREAAKRLFEVKRRRAAVMFQVQFSAHTDIQTQTQTQTHAHRHTRAQYSPAQYRRSTRRVGSTAAGTGGRVRAVQWLVLTPSYKSTGSSPARGTDAAVRAYGPPTAGSVSVVLSDVVLTRMHLRLAYGRVCTGATCTGTGGGSTHVRCD